MASEKEKRLERYEEPPRRASRRGRGCLGSLLLAAFSPFRLILLAGLAIIVLIVVVAFAGFMRNPVDNFLSAFGFDRNAKPQVVDSRTIVLSIQDMAVLETVQGGIQITKTVVDTSAAPDAEMEVSYVGTVKAGVDLSQVSAQDVTVNADNSLTITLPPAQITHCDLGKPDVHRWDCRGWAGLQDCTARRERVESVAYDRAMEELLQTGYELDLLNLASQNAQSTLYGLLKSLGYEQVTFQPSTAETPPPDVSCLVDAPAN
jgi:hypothetical protein